MTTNDVSTTSTIVTDVATRLDGVSPPIVDSIVGRSEQAIDDLQEIVAQESSVGVSGSKIGDIEANVDDIELTVVIPVYNEPVTVLEIVAKVCALPIRKQVIVVNDGSTDATPFALQKLEGMRDVTVFHHPCNRGKGAALQTGFERALGKYVIVQDADLEYDPSDILRVIEPLRAGEARVVYGSRYLDRAEQDPSHFHRFGNWALTTFSNLMTGHRLTDMETCYKAFRRDVLANIHIEQDRFGFEPEITAKLAQQRVTIREVGIRYSSRSHKEGKKIGWRDLFNALYCIVRYSLIPSAMDHTR